MAWISRTLSWKYAIICAEREPLPARVEHQGRPLRLTDPPEAVVLLPANARRKDDPLMSGNHPLRTFSFGMKSGLGDCMDTREAFDAIKQGVNADPRKTPLESFFDERAFGNFWVIYEEGGERLSVVNDRGQLILYEGSAGERFRTMLVSDLRDADKKAVLDAVS